MRVAVLGILLASLGGCSMHPARAADAAPAMECAAPLAPFVRNTLYFGLSSPLVPNDTITPEIWRTFSREVLTEHFPSGMTVIDMYGEWRAPDGRHFGEDGKLVVVLAELTRRHAADDAVKAVIAEAKRRFAFESVLWEQSRICAGF